MTSGIYVYRSVEPSTPGPPSTSEVKSTELLWTREREVALDDLLKTKFVTKGWVQKDFSILVWLVDYL